MTGKKAAKAARPSGKLVDSVPSKMTEPKSRQAIRWNREGQRWTEDRIGMTLRLPPDLEMDIRQIALAKGDLARIVLFAMEHVAQHDVDLVKTRKAGLGLGRPMLLHVGAAARQYLRGWAEKEQASVNQVVVSLLEKFISVRKKNSKLRRELDLELRAMRRLREPSSGERRTCSTALCTQYSGNQSQIDTFQPRTIQ